MHLKITPSTPKWIKYSAIHQCELMAKDHLILGEGSFIIFWNLTNGQQKYYKAGGKPSGDGVKYAAGHKLHYMFAFAEKCFNPRILLMSYPDFTRIAVLSDGQKFGYAKLTFSETDYLISLSTYPYYEIIVWNWRTGEKLNSTRTDILTDDQLLKVMFVNSILNIAQLRTSDYTQLSVWELLVCCKKSVFNEIKVNINMKNKLVTATWTTEGTLFLADVIGYIYMLNGKQELEIVISCKNIGTHKPCLVWYKNGLLIYGPDNNIRYYKKSGQWILERTVECPEPFIRLLTSPKDLVCISETDNIYTFNLNDNTFNMFLTNCGGLTDICMIYPMGNRMVSLAHNTELALWEIETGKFLDVMKLQAKALCLKENPEYPYVGVSFENGILSLISIYDLDKLTLMASFHLTKNPLSSIYFTEIGKLIVTADTSVGQFFIIEGYPGGKMQVLATVTANKQIADYILVASKTCLRLFAIVVTSQCYIAGNTIIRYCIIKGQTPEYKEYKLEEYSMLYSKLFATNLPNRDRVFYATPLTTKSIHQMETKRGDDCARVIGTIETNHQMKKILYHVDSYNTISYAYDGLVFVYSDFLQTEKYIVAPHHRMDGGIKRAYIDPNGKFVISIDRLNVMICSVIDHVKVLTKQREQLRELHFTPKFELLFTHPTTGFMPKGDLIGKTWLEVQEINKREKERLKCQEERVDIWNKFLSIRNSIRQLLTANIEGPDNEKLNLQMFNIDLELKREKLKKSREDCERMKAYLLAKIVAQDKVTHFIKSYCLDVMSMPGKSINAFYENYEVTNYTTVRDSFFSAESFLLLCTFREMESFVSSKDMFRPWSIVNKDQLEEKLCEPPSFKPEEIATVLLQIVEEDDEEMNEETRAEMLKMRKDREAQNLNAVEGNVAHNYIKLEPQNYTQFEVITFFQTELQKLLSDVESSKIKKYFNGHFDSLKTIKEREMFNIKEYNQRLRHIISEINYFSRNKLSVIIDDPEYRQEEYPERILTVEDVEISITPYISPSEQAILDAEAAEAERIRLLLLADDFRERALMAMMNGVLEVRWEDELRKEVSKPKCLLEKQPEEFNEDDLRAMRQYEIDVAFLDSERERYKVLLDAEYGKVAQNVRESVKKFNGRLDELFLLKLKIDSALNQYNLRMYRKRLHYHNEIVMLENERGYENDITRYEQEIESKRKLIESLYDNLNDTRAYYDNLMAKEKILEKNLRKDFGETSPMVQDQVQKLYKKRPKASIRSMLTSSLYFELARAIITHERPKILSNECVEFLKAVDNIDLYVGISSTVDENNYVLLCKHRRLRIENELKMKGLFADITEGENTIAILQKAITELKEKQQEATNNLSSLRTNKLLSFKDIELQMVLRGGIIEVPLRGNLTDFNDAILVSRKEVEDINDIIIKVGRKKIKAMEDVLKFKRGILSKEWEHKRLKMRISDLNDMLAHINSVKVTKEVQAYLKAKIKGEKEEKITFEQEVELVKKSFERIIDEMRMNVKELQLRINTIKRENKNLDLQISNVNVDVCEHKLEYDYDMDQNERDTLKLRMSSLLKRAKLIREIQNNHNEILILQTELEILRLKTFPTLKYKILN